MQSLHPTRRGLLIVLLSVLVAHLILLLTARLLPFTDLPFHLAAATVVRFYGDQANHFTEYYSINTFIQPNVFHLLFTSSSLFPSVEVGNQVFLVLYALLLVASVHLLIRELGGNPWFSLLSLLMLYNSNVRWGFVGFMISIPFLLLLFYTLLRSARSNAWWLRLASAGLLVLVFSSHALTTVFALAVVLVVTAYHYRRAPLRMLLELAVMVPVVLMVATWWRTSQGDSNTGAFLIEYYSHEFLATYVKRGKMLFIDNYFLYPGIWGVLVGTLFSLVILVPVLYLLVTRFRNTVNQFSKTPNVFLLLLLAVSLGICLLAPNELPEQWSLYQRFSVFVYLSMILIGSVLYTSYRGSLLPAAFSVAVLVHLIMCVEYQVAFERENASFTQALLPEDGHEYTLAGIICNSKFRDRFMYQHYVNYYVTWNQGIAATRFIDYRFGTVRRKIDPATLPVVDEWMGSDLEKYDGRYGKMDYILVRERDKLPEEQAKYLDQYEEVKHSGPWTLYRRSTTGPVGISEGN